MLVLQWSRWLYENMNRSGFASFDANSQILILNDGAPGKWKHILNLQSWTSDIWLKTLQINVVFRSSNHKDWIFNFSVEKNPFNFSVPLQISQLLVFRRTRRSPSDRILAQGNHDLLRTQTLSKVDNSSEFAKGQKKNIMMESSSQNCIV